MKIPVLLFSALCAVLAITGVRAADTAGHDHDDHTELGEHMEKISFAYRRLNRQIADATKNESSLELAAAIRTNAEAALKLQPEKTADLPPEQQPGFVADYRANVRHFIADVEKLEAALKAGKNDEAAALMKTLKADQGEGHKQFQKKKDKKM